MIDLGTVGVVVALATVNAALGAAVMLFTLTTRTLHLAVGEVVVAGVLIDVAVRLGVDAPALAPPAAVAAGAVLTAVLAPLVVDRFAGATRLVAVVAAAATLQAWTVTTLGTSTVRPAPLLPFGDPVVFGVTLDGATVAAAVVAGTVVIALDRTIVATRWGRRVRLVGDAPAAVELLGIPARRVRAQALAVAGAVTVLAGLAVAPVAFAGPGEGAAFAVRGVAAAVLVGGRRPAAAFGVGAVLAVAEVVGQRLAPAWGGTVALGVAVVAWAVAARRPLRTSWMRAW